MAQIKGCIDNADAEARVAEKRGVVKVQCAVTMSQSKAGQRIVYLMTVKTTREKIYLFGSETDESGRE